jgi:uncharacterized protein
VNQPRHPLRINVGFLIHSPIGTSRDIHFEYPHLKLAPDLEVKDFAGLARIGRTPQGMLFQCEFSGITRCECVRCLAEFDQPLKTEFSELYAFTPQSVTDSNLLVPEDGNIDLDDLAREYLVVEIPINPLCRPDCKGLCVECGADLNVEVCEHVQKNRE